MSGESLVPTEDAAWASIETPFDAAELRAFLGDVERLFRINSLMTFESWEAAEGGGYRFRAHNQSNGQTIDVGMDATFDDCGVVVRYDGGLKTSTSFRIEPRAGGGANLVLTDDYSGTPASEREARIEEVDRSVVQWARDLQRYMRQWKKWSWAPGWRLYMRRVWQPMRPMARRIVFMLIVITIMEFVMFLFVFTIFWLELDRFIG